MAVASDLVGHMRRTSPPIWKHRVLHSSAPAPLQAFSVNTVRPGGEMGETGAGSSGKKKGMDHFCMHSKKDNRAQFNALFLACLSLDCYVHFPLRTIIV